MRFSLLDLSLIQQTTECLRSSGKSKRAVSIEHHIVLLVTQRETPWVIHKGQKWRFGEGNWCFISFLRPIELLKKDKFK